MARPGEARSDGGFYHKFDAATPATGDYQVRFEPDSPKPKDKAGATDQPPGDDADGQADASPTSCGNVPFKKEAYRLPTFEVLLNGPQQVPLDGEFSIDLISRYFAGGLVADRP